MNKLAVILPVYDGNDTNFLIKALHSLLDQTYQNFDLVIAEDGKVNNHIKKIISSTSKKKNLKVLSFEKNQGLPIVLNEMINYCKKKEYEYIARMDADDISLPERLEKEITFLKKNKTVSLVGTSAYIINEHNEISGEKNLPKTITFNSLLKNCDLIHPSIMFRASFFDTYGLYNTDFKKSQDYELWLRAAKNGAVIKNLSEKLFYLRYEKNLISRRKKEQLYNIKIKNKYIKGIKLLLYILPNILIMVMPNFFIKLLLKIKK